MAYWGRVLEVMEHLLDDPDLTFYLVWPGAGGPPSDGPDVVAIGVAVEAWRDLARSAHRIRATFQSGGPAPPVPGSMSGPLVPALTALGLRCRSQLDRLRWQSGRLWTHLRGEGPRPVFAVPLGYLSAPSRPVRPIADRPIELSFAGSVKHWSGWWGDFTAKMGAPKVRSRREMLRAVNRLLRSHPDVEAEIRVTESYADLGPTQSSDAYWQLLMNTKICLVPAGTNCSTSRHFEALLAGCVIVTDAPLEGWYVSNAPFIELQSWDDLEAAVLPLLSDEAELKRLHQAALAWWESHCAEEVVGRFIASRLNDWPRAPAKRIRHGPLASGHLLTRSTPTHACVEVDQPHLLPTSRRWGRSVDARGAPRS